MAILYSMRSVKAFNAERNQYAIVAKALGRIGINELAVEMSAESTVTRHDVKAVLSSLEDHIMRNLRKGNTVQLGDLGSFYLTLNSSLVDTPEEVSPLQIKGVNVRFTPSKTFKNAMKPSSNFVSFKPFYGAETGETVPPGEKEETTGGTEAIAKETEVTTEPFENQ